MMSVESIFYSRQFGFYLLFILGVKWCVVDYLNRRALLSASFPISNTAANVQMCVCVCHIHLLISMQIPAILYHLWPIIRLCWRRLVCRTQSTWHSAEYKWDSCQKKNQSPGPYSFCLSFFSACLGQWLCRRAEEEMMWLRDISAWLLSAGCVKGKVTSRWTGAWRNFLAHEGNGTK